MDTERLRMRKSKEVGGREERGVFVMFMGCRVVLFMLWLPARTHAAFV